MIRLQLMCCALSIFVRLNFGGWNDFKKIYVESDTNRQVELVAEFRAVGVAEYTKAIAKMKVVQDIIL